MLIRWGRSAGYVLAIGYLVGLGIILLSPSAERPIVVVSRVTQMVHSLGVPRSLAAGAQVEFALNAIMFLPFGLAGWLLREGWWRPWTAAMSGGVVALTAECLQGLLLDGRSASLRDLAANLLGAGMGAVLASIAAQVMERRQPGSSRPM